MLWLVRVVLVLVLFPGPGFPGVPLLLVGSRLVLPLVPSGVPPALGPVAVVADHLLMWWLLALGWRRVPRHIPLIQTRGNLEFSCADKLLVFVVFGPDFS